MNDKFDDLMYEAGLTAQGCWDEMDEYNRTAIMKFAELIVKECAKSLWTDECHTSDLAVEDFNRNSKRIKQHFGVEERKGWVCPKCSVDRLKEQCPLFNNIPRMIKECPMKVEAQ